MERVDPATALRIEVVYSADARSVWCWRGELDPTEARRLRYRQHKETLAKRARR
jgi:hypothetical protein